MHGVNPYMDTRTGPIVVLHGWGHDRTYWKDFAEHFSDREVVILELPGFGNETQFNPQWGIPEYAKWVHSKIEERGLKNASLIGHSLGGRIAGYIASQQPAWLKNLVLYGAPVLYRPSFKTKMRILIAKLLKPFVPARWKRFSNPELAEADRRGLGAVYRLVVSFDETELLPKIQVPTLLLWGERDTTVPVRIAREAQALIKESRIVVVSGTGHNMHLENPALFYGLISRFIDA